MNKMQAEIKITSESTTVDIVKYLQSAESDEDIAKIVETIDAQGKAVFGNAFQLRFDPAIPSNNFRDRVFVTLPIRRLVSET